MAGQGTGSCAQCEHYRVSSSVAGAAYAGILPAYQPKLRQAQTLKIQDESQAQGIFVQERQVEPQYADVQWLSRPTHLSFGYCGFDEFDGRYYKCEVKNADQNCPDLTPTAAGAAPRPCSSCRHHRPPLGHPVRVLEETFRRYGQAPGAMRLQANAEAAIVARCLSMLGASPDHIAAVCNSFTQVFGEPWDQQLSAQIGASAPLVAPSASQFPQTGAPQVGAGPGGSGGSGALGTQPTQMSGAANEADQACYHNGDLEAAEARFRQAVELGYTQAAIGLGNVIQDTEEMIRWWRWAAEQGNLVAIDCLIAEYELGENPDPAEVLRWYRASAAHPDQKHPAEVREAIARCEKELRAPEKAARKLDRLLRHAASGGDWEAIYKAGMKRYEHWEWSRNQEKFATGDCARGAA